MAQSFQDWLNSRGMSYSADNPDYVVSAGASPSRTSNSMYATGVGGSMPVSVAMNQWKQESSGGALADLLSGGAAASANPFGGSVPTVNNTNRFEAGLTDTESRLRALLDNPDSINQSAAYKFRVKQGEEAVNRQLGAKGMLNSGNRLMELTKYGQDMGSQEYDAQAGRLGSLLGNYSQSWLGDKNANTSRYSAQANAWNQAQGNADANRYRMGSLAWEMSKPQTGGGSGSRSQTNFSSIGGSSNLGAIGGSTDLWNDPQIQRMRQSRVDAYNY